MAPNADQTPLQRPFTDIICPLRPSFIGIDPPRSGDSHVYHQGSRYRSSRIKRRLLTPPWKRRMNLQSEHESSDGSMSIPRFALDINSAESREDYARSPPDDAFFPHNDANNDANKRVENGQRQFRSFYRPRSSASTSPSASPESSPSILESASTPGTSPDTPASFHSYTYPSLSSMAMRASDDKNPDLRPPATPLYKKPRNLKNLAVNTSSNVALGRAVSTASLPVDAPASPASASTSSLPFPPASFALPPAPPRRRPSGPGLTIMTPSLGSFSLRQEAPKITTMPLLSRPETLRQFQSSPSLPLHSAVFPPEGGMRLPTFSAGGHDQVSVQDEDVRLEHYNVSPSQEAKPDAYPHGPICIYDPLVDLYFEPTAEEASKYDVIFNVASEVKNPFQLSGRLDVVPIDLKAAVEALADPPSSPSTPKASVTASGNSEKAHSRRPEYIHVPWEHNTDIVPGTDSIPSLHDIVRIIDSRVKSGKRVLIHCQCGVSRSASLVVAYGLYKNPSTTVQDAYDAVKQKSEWIGPNMNLIMQLQEFRNILLRPGRASFSRQSFQNSSHSKVLHGRTTANGTGDQPNGLVPQTAPLPKQTLQAIDPQTSTGNYRDVSPGPSSAPSDLHWPTSQHTENINPVATVQSTYPTASIVNATGQVLQPSMEVGVDQPINGNKKRLAIRTGEDYKSTQVASPQGMTIPPPLTTFFPQRQESPRSAEFAMSAVRTDEDESFGITSPRPVEFTPLSSFSASPTSPIHGPREVLSSPRSFEFAMTSIRQPDFDPTLGLTSPRNTTFDSSYLSHRPQQLTTASFAASQPPEDADSASAQARAELRCQLGFNSSRSTGDARAEQDRSGPAGNSMMNITAVPPPPSASVLAESAVDPGFSDALMSPRATEFTSNPFHDLADNGLLGETTEATGGSSGDATPIALDPRSPPLKGGSPIVRNIMDVLW